MVMMVGFCVTHRCGLEKQQNQPTVLPLAGGSVLRKKRREKQGEWESVVVRISGISKQFPGLGTDDEFDVAGDVRW